jgi:transposase
MMLSMPPSVRIYFATGLVDMRNGIDGLCALVSQVFKKDPLHGHLFVFVGRRRDRLKILFWDRNGFVLYQKRLERGRFQLPVADETRSHVKLEASELAMLLDGIDLNAKRLLPWRPSIERGIDADR